jgi:hypothetical protein
MRTALVIATAAWVIFALVLAGALARAAGRHSPRAPREMVDLEQTKESSNRNEPSDGTDKADAPKVNAHVD